MNIIDKLATAVEAEPSTEMEEICRHAVALEMRHAKRLLTADEVEDIVDDVVSEEALADTESLAEDGEVEVTDLERANMDDDEIVVFEDENGENIEGVVVEGRFARLVVVPDRSRSVISASIARHIEHLAHLATISDGIDKESLYHPVPDVLMPCPKCASMNVTPVWYDAGEVVACCNICGNEFDASIDDVIHATLAERTVEDIDILPEFDVFGSVWLEDDGYGYEVYASGELVDSGSAEEFIEVQDRFEDIADAYDDIEEGTQIDFINGDSDVIEEIDSDDVIFEAGRKASRIRLARMVVDKMAYIDNSNVTARRRYTVGQAFSTKVGHIEIDEIDRNGIYATVTSGMPSGRIAQRQMLFSQRELDGIIA